MNNHEKYEELKTITTHSSIKKLSWASVIGSLIIPPAGIVFGHIALSKILKQKTRNNKYLLITILGLALGYFSTVTLIISLASLPEVFKSVVDTATEYKNTH